jgi:hypothetical protein
MYVTMTLLMIMYGLHGLYFRLAASFASIILTLTTMSYIMAINNCSCEDDLELPI